MSVGDPKCPAHGALLPCGECLRISGQAFAGNAPVGGLPEQGLREAAIMARNLLQRFNLPVGEGRKLAEITLDALNAALARPRPALPTPDPAFAYAPWVCVRCGVRNEVRPVAWETFVRCVNCGEKRPNFDLASFGAALPAEHAPPDLTLDVEAIADDQLDDLGRGYAIMPANFSESDCRMALRNMLRGIAAMQSIAFGSRPALAGSPLDEQQAAKIKELEARHDARDRSNEKDAP